MSDGFEFLRSSEIDRNRADLKLHAAVYRWAARQFDPGMVLDVGSELGVGISLMKAENSNLLPIGCDIDLKVMRVANEYLMIEEHDRFQANASRLPVMGASLSGISLINILHIVESPVELLTEANRVLVPEGKVVLYIDMSKRPYGSDEQQPRKQVDALLSSEFTMLGSNEILDGGLEKALVELHPKREMYLRIGIKA